MTHAVLLWKLRSQKIPRIFGKHLGYLSCPSHPSRRGGSFWKHLRSMESKSKIPFQKGFVVQKRKTARGLRWRVRQAHRSRTKLVRMGGKVQKTAICRPFCLLSEKWVRIAFGKCKMKFLRVRRIFLLLRVLASALANLAHFCFPPLAGEWLENALWGLGKREIFQIWEKATWHLSQRYAMRPTLRGGFPHTPLGGCTGFGVEATYFCSQGHEKILRKPMGKPLRKRTTPAARDVSFEKLPSPKAEAEEKEPTSKEKVGGLPNLPRPFEPRDPRHGSRGRKFGHATRSSPSSPWPRQIPISCRVPRV